MMMMMQTTMIKILISILDDVTLVQDTVVPVNRTEKVNIFADNVVGCDHQLVVLNLVVLPAHPHDLNLWLSAGGPELKFHGTDCWRHHRSLSALHPDKFLA
jgi:hypothetical protein